jgi:hypothetical protein
LNPVSRSRLNSLTSFSRSRDIAFFTSFLRFFLLIKSLNGIGNLDFLGQENS